MSRRRIKPSQIHWTFHVLGAIALGAIAIGAFELGAIALGAID